MAAEWIKMRVDLQTHPKIVRILSATRSDKFRVIGGLHAVWCVFDTHSIDGVLNGYTPEAMDSVVGWTGLADAMITSGWLEYDGDQTLTMPEFEAHNGQSGKRRAEDQKRKREQRKNPQPVPDSSDDELDRLRTREEERRGEVKDTLPSEESDQGKPDNAPSVPYEQIFNAYAAKLPTLPQLKIKDKARKDLVKSAWRRDERFQTVEFWEKYFDYVKKSPFLMTEFKAIGFDWLMKPANFKKVLEGNYHEHA